MTVKLNETWVEKKKPRNSAYGADTQTGTVQRRLSNHNVFWKQNILKIFCQRNKNIYEFKSYFLRGKAG